MFFLWQLTGDRWQVTGPVCYNQEMCLLWPELMSVVAKIHVCYGQNTCQGQNTCLLWPEFMSVMARIHSCQNTWIAWPGDMFVMTRIYVYVMARTHVCYGQYRSCPAWGMTWCKSLAPLILLQSFQGGKEDVENTGGFPSKCSWLC